MKNKVNMSSISNKIKFIYGDECEKNTVGMVIFSDGIDYFFDAEYKNKMSNEEVEALLLRGAVISKDGRYCRPYSFDNNKISFSESEDSEVSGDYVTQDEFDSILFEDKLVESIVSSNDYTKMSNMGISGTNEANGKFTKALLEPQNNIYSGVSIIKVEPGEVYKVSGNTMYNVYNALGLIFSDTCWEDSFTTNNRINIISGDYDYYCEKTGAAWSEFNGYEITVPNGAYYMYVRGNEVIIKKELRTVSTIPTKISDLEDDSDFTVDKFKYFKDFLVVNDNGVIADNPYNVKNSECSVQWNLEENSSRSAITFSNINLKCNPTDTVGLWVYLNKAITDRYTTRDDGNTIDSIFKIKFNGDAFVSSDIYAGYKCHNGWNYLEFTPNLTSIDSISMIFTRIYDDYEIFFDSIELNYKVKRTKILLSFDNNQANLYENIYPLLKERGFVGTYALPTAVLDNAGTTGVSLNNHNELMNNGWDYAYYAGANRPSFDAEIDTWISYFNDWKAQYENIGIGLPICYFSPINRSDKNLIYAEKIVGFKMNRSMIATDCNLIDNWDKDTFELTCIGISTAEGSSHAIDAIDDAIEKGRHLCIFAHEVLETTNESETINVSESVYIEMLNYLKIKVDFHQCDVITFREFYQMHEPVDYAEFMAIRHNIELNSLRNK